MYNAYAVADAAAAVPVLSKYNFLLDPNASESSLQKTLNMHTNGMNSIQPRKILCLNDGDNLSSDVDGLSSVSKLFININ